MPVSSSFVVTGVSGREHPVVIMTEDPLGVDWLPSAPTLPDLVLTTTDVDRLLAWLRSLEGDWWLAVFTYFDVVT